MKGSKANRNNAGTMSSGSPTSGANLSKSHGGKAAASGAPMKAVSNASKNTIKASRATGKKG